MTTTEGRGVMRRCRGRPRVNRHIDLGEPPRCYAPRCWISPAQEFISLRPEEVEILRLVDLDGLEQEEAAGRLGVSRKTAWRDLHEARRKVADALVHGKVIEVAKCERRQEGNCPRWNTGICPKQDGGPCPRGFLDDSTDGPRGSEETGEP